MEHLIEEGTTSSGLVLEDMIHISTITWHEAPSYYATNKDRDQRCQKHDNRSESRQQSSVPHERAQGFTGRLEPFASSLPDNAYMERDDLIAQLVQERHHCVEALRFLSFEYQTAKAIVRRWITLKMDAAAGGPYDLLGVALAAIAELGEPGEPDMRACHGDAVLNREALAAIQNVGVYLAPDFTKAKWLVYHTVLRRWEKLLGPGETVQQTVPVPMTACY
ncbi:hypothetical protein GGR55DRAFT_698333 [Xylaria sp. FL0064]|nr:hypothetical protein GGR55DRAFT_698333 [Xylaria sp. FL0064]